MIAALVTAAAGALLERWWLGQAGYAVVFLVLLQFAARRFLGRAAGRRPPAAFVLIPFAMAQGLAGSGLIAAASLHAVPPSAMSFGKLLVVQPDYRVPALHILFIGGFGMMAFGVATHVSLGHLGLDHLSLGRPPAVVALAIGFVLALAVRLAADASDTYFEHLSWAAGAWLAGSAVWCVFFTPHWVRPPR